MHIAIYTCGKPEPNMLKILPIIPFSISQKFYPLFLFYSHIITYYSHFVLLAFIVSGINSRETWTLYVLCCSYCVNVSDAYAYTSKIGSESHPYLSFNCLISCVTVCTDVNIKLLGILPIHHAYKHPIILKLCL